ncbi:protein-(glutamine-N5) methyltransferase, release factor-specific [Halobacteroides halobius DSM 5150]|uniref:Release factor glutamine methyltransferase n=1 Tax=Halobacteroides halobius (strain ATCC 35273 / DSM 5150 / MD-1) TaxID=748449 RepID=L0KBI0_HALHC|nr:peptide chain release factor N(5)-glutamine methyltransferase [Halobacteroides halobius]AGB42351.1 protein-(glutamine-N5) methyltransferase, release factor-specific [Halobacteroides halobius DSM 5150]
MARLTVKEILDKAVGFFKEHQLTNPRLDAEVLLADILEMQRIKLYVNFNRPLTKEEIDRYRELIVARSQGQPVAYLLGEQEFMSLDFEVNSNVLIPRPETEHLVETILEKIDQNDEEKIRVADIGTGSGAIIISLIKLADKKVQGVGIDISNTALELAYKNALHHEVAGKIEFKEGNLVQPLDEPVDMIVSNPPYIPTNDLEDLQEEVKQEPSLALDGGADGLKFYRQIIKQAAKKLTEAGLIAFEVGIKQAEDVADLLKQTGFKEIEIIEDYAEIKRVVLGRL